MIVVLPLPDKRLSPNARVHYHTLATAKRKAKADALIATMAAVNGGMREERHRRAGTGPIAVGIFYYPPTRRNRDFDNALSSLKASLDGIAEALAVNDSRFLPTLQFMPPEKPGRVEIVL